MWRNAGILFGWLLFYVAAAALALERKDGLATGGAVSVYKRGQLPLANELEPEQQSAGARPGPANPMPKSSIARSGDAAPSPAGSLIPSTPGTYEDRCSNVFTWSGVSCKVSVPGGIKQLLTDQHGYVRPGRITVLMGASGA